MNSRIRVCPLREAANPCSHEFVIEFWHEVSIPAVYNGGAVVEERGGVAGMMG